jgi:hypothetical protein
LNELAKRLNVRPQTIRRWFAGSAPIPDRIDAWLEEVRHAQQLAPRLPESWNPP